MRSFIINLLCILCIFYSTRAERVLHLSHTVGATDAPPHSIVVVDSLVFFSGNESIELTCVNGKSGERHFSVEGKKPSDKKWESKGLFVVDDHLVQIYSYFQFLYVRALSKKGKILYESTFDYAESGVMVELSVTDDKALIGLHGKAFSLAKSPAIILVDLKKKKILSEIAQPGLRRNRGNLTGTDITVFTVENQKVPSYVAFDNRTGKKLWTYTGTKGQYYRASLCDDSILVFNDGRNSVYQVDATSGELIKKKTIEQSKPVPYAYPLTTKDGETYVAFDKLTQLDENFSISKVAQKSAWLTHNMLVHGSHLIAHTSDKLYVYNHQNLQRVKTFENAQGWSFEGNMIPFDDGFIVINRFRRNYEYDTELWFFKSSETSYLDLAAFNPTTALYERGRFLSMGGKGVLSLPAATYTIDLLGGGFTPRRIVVKLTSGDTLYVQDAEKKRGRIESETLNYERNRLPVGYSLKELSQRKARVVSHPLALKKAKTLMESKGVLFGTRPQGLAAFDPVKEKILWQIPSDSLVSLLKPLKLRKFGRPEFYLAKIIPHKNMLIIVTEEYMTNRFGAFDMQSGKLLWVAPIRVPLAYKSAQSGRFSQPFDLHDGLLWGKTGYTIYALDIETGNKVFEKIVASGNKEQWGNLIFVDNSLIYYLRYGNQGFLHSISLYDQKESFTLKLSPPVELFDSPEGNSFYLLRKGQICEYSQKGKQLHATSIRPRITDMEPVFDKDRIYLTSNFASQFHAFSRKNLKKLWTYVGSDEHRDPAAVLAGDSDVASTSDGSMIQVFDGATGKVETEIPKSDLPLGKIKAYWEKDGRLYLSTFHSTYIFEP